MNRFAKADLRSLIAGISSNRSIQKVVFTYCIIERGYIFPSCVPFLKNNANLTSLYVDG